MKPSLFLFLLGSSCVFFTLTCAQAQTQQKQQKACAVNCKLTGQPQNVTCALDPESVEGPYYLPLHLMRSNITEDRAGVSLKMHLTIMDSSTCQPVEGSTVDVWHADAYGIYSGYGNIPNTTFLRGIQVTNKTGDVSFDTIYPGYYEQRVSHVHVEVYVGGALKHTGQLYFPEEISEAVRTAKPYASRKDVAPMLLEKDGLYMSMGGADTTFENVLGDVKDRTGLQAAMHVGIDPQAVMERRVGGGQGVGGPGPGLGRNSNST